MPELSIILAGLGDAFTPMTLLFVLAGVAVGQFVGAVPGIGPVMATAIAIPFTFGMDPLAGIGFLVGVNKGGLVGGAIPAVLLNTPGTPDAAATALDGYPLARKGPAVEGDQDGALFLGHRRHVQRHRPDHRVRPAGHSGPAHGPGRGAGPDDAGLCGDCRADGPVR